MPMQDSQSSVALIQVTNVCPMETPSKIKPDAITMSILLAIMRLRDRPSVSTLGT